MKKIFSLKTMMLILIGFGIFFILAGMNALNNNYEIDGCGYLFVGTSFIITGTSLLVKLKE